jgi:hypothetical protein
MPRSTGFTARQAGIVAAVLVIGLGLGAGGFALFMANDGATTPAPAALAEPAPAPEPAPTPAPEPEAAPALEPVATVKPRTEPKPEPEAKPKPRKKPKKPAAPKEKVKVMFRLDGPRLAFVRIDRKKVGILEPAADMKLPVGKHHLEWRLFDDEPWQSAGTIRLKPGRDYTVEISEEGPTVK